MALSEKQVKKIIQKELASIFVDLDELIATDRYIFQKNLQLFNGRNIQTGRGTGTKIATATDQKLSVYGVTPIIQGTTISDPSGGGDDGVDTPARTAINDLINRLQAFGIIA